MKFTKNVGGLDAVLRIGVGAGLVYVGFISSGLINDDIASIMLGVFGVGILASGVFRCCPLYNLIGFSSRSGDTDTWSTPAPNSFKIWIFEISYCFTL